MGGTVTLNTCTCISLSSNEGFSKKHTVIQEKNKLATLKLLSWKEKKRIRKYETAY
jgi:hypothetical protein